MRKEQFIKFVFIALLLVIGIVQSNAQSTLQEFLSSKDLSNFKVEYLSDADILRYKTFLQSSGLTESQAEQLALQKGLPTSELLKLKARVAGLSAVSDNKNNNGKSKSSNYRQQEDTLSTSQNNLRDNNLLKKPEDIIFGSDLFSNADLKFEPNLRIPTPKNYIIGPDDEIAIDVYGFQETNPRLIVSPEGFINIPNVGYVAVNGLTIEAATKRIRDKMIKNGYARIATGETKLEVSISKIRTIKVSIIGMAKKPGSYSLSSLSTVFNALYACGGPNEKGSLRKIEIIRNNKIIAVLDAYDFLLKGLQSNNIKLTDQDVIRIPAAEVLVKLKGEVKQPGIYEMLPTENLEQLIEYAQNFTGKAYTAAVTVTSYNNIERTIQDIKREKFSLYKPKNGDEVNVGKLLDRFNNRVVIEGAVFRPGAYEFSNNLTLYELVQKANGLKEHAYKDRALLFRTNEDLTKEVIAFNLEDIAAKNILLKKNDSVVIASNKDFQELFTVTVDGEVKKPGVYEFYKGLTLKDIIFQTGGFTDAATPQRIEIARRIKKDTGITNTIAEVLEVATAKDLLTGTDVALQPWDVIMVRSNPGYKAQISVKIEGEVLYPGTYVLSTREDKVSDIIKRAGGLTPQADNRGATITRINTSIYKDDAVNRIQKIKKGTDTSTNQLIEDLSSPTVKIGLQLDEILNNKGNALENITLLEGDIITVPKQRNVVKVNGEVMFPTEVVFKQGADIDYYIDKAGGFTENAKKGKLYVLNANGSAAKTKRFLFFRNFPDVTPGAEILVPKIEVKERKGLSAAEWLAVASGLASLASVAVAIINVRK
jgi:protein involved in polysaccharide export with SLBB domain